MLIKGIQSIFLKLVRTLLATSVMTLGSATGCGAQDPKNAECTGSMLYRKCVITSGSHSGFVIGMSKESAFQNSCERTREKKLNGHPVLYTNGERKGYPQTSICNLNSEAMAAERWIFIEPAGLRERTITLEFGEIELEKITWQLRGMDP